MLPQGCKAVGGSRSLAHAPRGTALWGSSAGCRRRRHLRCAAVDRQQVDSAAAAEAARQQQTAAEPHLECFGTGMEVECRLVQEGPPHVPVPGEEPVAVAAAVQQQPQQQEQGEGHTRLCPRACLPHTCLFCWQAREHAGCCGALRHCTPPMSACSSPASPTCCARPPYPPAPTRPCPPMQARWLQCWMPHCLSRLSSSGAHPWLL